jgi:hypothetical protein
MIRSSGPRTASTMQNSLAPMSGGLTGGVEHLVRVEERGGQHRGVEARRLGTEVAVLRAASGLGRQDPLDLDGVAAPIQADLVGEGRQRWNDGVRHCGQFGQLGRRQPLAPHHQLISGRGQGVECRRRGHGSTW